MRASKKDIIAAMFLPAALVMIFTQLTGVVANIIDGIVTSRFLGSDAYSSVSLLAPMVNVILLFASFVSLGGQIVCASKIGKGERDEADAVFSFSILAGIFIGAVFVFLCVAAPGILFRICGVSIDSRPELYAYMLSYLRGYLPGIPAVIMTQVLSPYFVMDNGKRLTSIASIVLCVADIAGDLANVFVFSGGVFGMGVATSVAMWLQLLTLLFHFFRGSGYFRFSLRALTVSHVKDIVKNGELTFLKRFATILRDIGTNRINLLVALGTAAVAAKGIQSDLNMLMFSIGIGIGITLLSMSSMYYGAEDKDGLIRSFSYAIRLSMRITVPLGIILFLAAPVISGFYTSEAEVLDFAIFSIRCMAVGLPLDALTEIYQDYLQGIQNRKVVNILCFAERLFIPVTMSFILGMLFGSKGVMASIAVGKMLLILGMFTAICIRNRSVPKHTEGYMFLPEGFGGEVSDNVSAQLSDMQDVIRASEGASAFCRDHGGSKRLAFLIALFVEEMAGNIIRHGKARGRDKAMVDYRLSVSDGKVSLSLRDYCEEFDPMKYYEIHNYEELSTNIGIRMVMRLAKDINYVNTFSSNCLLINMELK